MFGAACLDLWKNVSICDSTESYFSVNGFYLSTCKNVLERLSARFFDILATCSHLNFVQGLANGFTHDNPVPLKYCQRVASF